MIDIGIGKDVARPLGKSIDNLVNKISSAAGLIYEPVHIRRVARAEADARNIAEIGGLKTELQKRTFLRLIAEESRKQENLEAIIDETIPLLTDAAKPEEMDNDWLNEFLDSAKKISDKEMQILWSRILAGETHRAGAFSKRTLQFVSAMRKEEAEIFAKLCRFYCSDLRQVVVVNLEDEIYRSNGITFELIHQLESIGLIAYDSTHKYVSRGLPSQFNITYGNARFSLSSRVKDGNTVLEFGHAILTGTGVELVPLSNAETIPGFVEYLSKHFEKSFDVNLSFT